MNLQGGFNFIMSFCPQCGTKVEPDWIHCPNCKYYLPERIEPSISKVPQITRETKKVDYYPRREGVREERRIDYKNNNSKMTAIIAILAILFRFSRKANIFLNIIPRGPGPPLPPPLTLCVGTPQSPFTLDPINAWDSASYDVIDQVAEPLFGTTCENRPCR